MGSEKERRSTILGAETDRESVNVVEHLSVLQVIALLNVTLENMASLTCSVTNSMGGQRRSFFPSPPVFSLF